MSRIMAEARCQARHHLVARLGVDEAAHRIVEVSRVFARDIRGEKIVRSVKYGGMTVDLDDESDLHRWSAFAVGCACGSDYMFQPLDLVNLTRPTDDKIPILYMSPRGVSR
jgi:hypothetical protein